MRALTLALALAASAAAGPVMAATFAFETFLDGPSEFPPNASPGTGYTNLVWDDVAHTIDVHAEWQDLVAPTTVAHIHAPTAEPGEGIAIPASGVPTFPGFPAGVTAGTYDIVLSTLALGTYNPAFVVANGGTAAGAEAALVAALFGGKAYLNIHTQAFPGGEIRGFYENVPLDAIPEPGTWALMIAGFGLAGAALRRRAARAPAMLTY